MSEEKKKKKEKKKVGGEKGKREGAVSYLSVR